MDAALDGNVDRGVPKGEAVSVVALAGEDVATPEGQTVFAVEGHAKVEGVRRGLGLGEGAVGLLRVPDRVAALGPGLALGGGDPVVPGVGLASQPSREGLRVDVGTARVPVDTGYPAGILT